MQPEDTVERLVGGQLGGLHRKPPGHHPVVSIEEGHHIRSGGLDPEVPGGAGTERVLPHDPGTKSPCHLPTPVGRTIVNHNHFGRSRYLGLGAHDRLREIPATVTYGDDHRNALVVPVHGRPCLRRMLSRSDCVIPTAAASSV